MENMQCLYWGQGFREAFAWQIIKWTYNLQLQRIFHVLCSEYLRLRSGGLGANGLTDLEKSQLYKDLISVDSPVSAHAHQHSKLTVWQLAIYTGAKCMSWPIMSFPTESKRTVWHEPVTSLSSQGPRSVVVGSEIQINWYRALVTLFTCFTHVHMPTLHASGRQLLYFRWGVKNDFQQLQYNKFLHLPSKSGTWSSQIQHTILTNVSALMGCLLVWATNHQA